MTDGVSCGDGSYETVTLLIAASAISHLWVSARNFSIRFATVNIHCYSCHSGARKHRCAVWLMLLDSAGADGLSVALAAAAVGPSRGIT